MSDGGQAAAAAAPEAALSALLAGYERWTLEMVAEMGGLLATACGRPEVRAQALQRLFEAAHDLKGQGASFGYPLVSRVGQSLCLIGHAISYEDAPVAALKAIKAHLEALRVILDKRIKGEGGALGARLAEKLEAMAT